MDSPNQQEQQQQRRQEESYAEDFFARYAEGILEDGAADDDESEDIDWKPYMRWFCINCTCPNPDEATHCIRCSEHRTSGILNQGYLASPFDSAGKGESQDKDPASKRDGVQSSHLSPDLMSSGALDLEPEKRTAIGYDPRMLLHEETEKMHPERPNRLRAILAGLEVSGLLPGPNCFSIPAREATQDELKLVHSSKHVDVVEATEHEDLTYFTPDTYANKYSALAARLAAGICADLATAIITGKAHNGFALVRPPGHHAEEETVMGFCLHNNACVAARAAQAAGANKVLIVDWDVHHGNGTQGIFEQDPTVLYISLHRYEGGTFYPGTGGAGEVGSGPGEGFCVNIPWGCGGIGDVDYLSAFQHLVLPISHQFQPDFTIISAGFDAARGDPLGGCDVTPSGYAHMTALLNSLSNGRMLVILEGGYNLRSISSSVAEVMKVLQGGVVSPYPDSTQPTAAGALAMVEVFLAQRDYWSDLHAPTFLKFNSQLAALSNGGRSARKRYLRRRHTGGPVWWKWGRRRVVYDFLFKNRFQMLMSHSHKGHRCSHKHH